MENNVHDIARQRLGGISSQPISLLAPESRCTRASQLARRGIYLEEMLLLCVAAMKKTNLSVKLF